MTPSERKAHIARLTKEANLIRRYGLTLQEHEAFLTKHNNRCGICSTDEDLCIDRNHQTKALRGVLCRHCNRALGAFKDSIERLQDAIKYLKHR